MKLVLVAMILGQMSLLGQEPQPLNTVVPAASVEPPRELSVAWREGMGRFEAAPGTRVLAPAAGRIVITEPAGILELRTYDGRVISFMTLGTQVAPGPVSAGQEIGTVGAGGFGTVLVRAAEKPKAGGGIPILGWRISEFSIQVRRRK